MLFTIALSILAACSATENSGTAIQADIEKTSAPWVLSPQDSRLNYTTIKLDDLAESNHFSTLSGTITPRGDANISIVLESVQTNIDTRDARMKKIVFETESFPLATVTANINMNALQSLKPGEQMTYDFTLAVSLKGLESEFDTQTIITRLGANKVQVQTQDPLYVHADDFNLQSGVDELQKLANLSSITPVVPVSFSLVFER